MEDPSQIYDVNIYSYELEMCGMVHATRFTNCQSIRFRISRHGRYDRRFRYLDGSRT